jgi:Pentapeptide repeats (8 copies)
MPDPTNPNPPSADSSTPSTEFTKTELKAASRAARSKNLDEIQKALEIIRAAAQDRAELSKLEQYCDSDWKPASTPVRRAVRWFLDTIGPNLTAIVALTTAIALVLQVYVARSTANLQNAAQEDSQWQTAIKNVKSSDPDDALIGAYTMQSFFESRRYGQHARAIAATLLPAVREKTSFDEVFFGLRRGICGQTNQNCKPTYDAEIEDELLGIGRGVATNAHDLFENMNSHNCDPNPCTNAMFRTWIADPNPNNLAVAGFDADMSLAIAYSWELDSVSQALRKTWAGKTKLMDPRNANLSGVILSGVDLTGADFSGANLQGTYFWGTVVKDADFSQIEHVENSDWQDTHWWHAKALSCPLAEHLEKLFEPAENQGEAQELARALKRNCKPITQP